MKNLGSLVWGSVLIALGVILGMNVLGVTNIDLFFPGWWTFLIIIPSIVGLLTEEHKSGSVACLLVGVLLLLGCLDVISFKLIWQMILPFGLVVFGIFLIARNTSNAAVTEKIRQAEEARRGGHSRHADIAEGEVVEDGDEGDDNDEEEENWTLTPEGYCAMFGDQKINYDGKKFSGCKVEVVFGSAELDLRKATIQNESVIRATSVFGNIVIAVPQDVKVEIAQTTAFGSVNNRKTKKGAKGAGKSAGKAKTIYIDAKCIFGGLEIR